MIGRRNLMGLSARGKSSLVIGAVSLDGRASYADGIRKRWQEIARWRLCAQIMSGDYTHGGALPEVITHLYYIEISLLLPARADVRNQVRT